MAFLGGLFGKRKRTIEDLPLDELIMAKAKLQQAQDKVMRQVSDLEKQKEKLFQAGVSAPSQRQRLLVAQQIKDLELQAKNYDQNLAAYSKQARVLSGVIFLKQNRKSWEDTPLGQLMGNMDLGELEVYVDQASAENSFQMDKFQQLLGIMEMPGKDEEMDEGVADILAQMEAARASGFAGAQLERPGETADTEAGQGNP